MHCFEDVVACRANPVNESKVKRLETVFGHLVVFPVNFLCHENLAVRWNKLEFLVPKQAFT